jgi:hypothetical protein
MRTLAILSILLLGLLSGCMPSGIAAPLDHMADRATPLHFGLYVTPDPAQNPINPPERFTGYHSAQDFEILSDEADKEVPVYAVCDGPIVYQDWVEGYGGVVIQECTWKNEPVTVLYGHVSTDSFTAKKGDHITHGTRLAVLAPGRSKDSDGNRMHLHLGIHKGTELEFRGYLQDPKELDTYINPLSIFSE